MWIGRIVSTLLASSVLMCWLPPLAGAAEPGNQGTRSVYFMRLFAFDDPGSDWRWDKRALRMFNEVLLIKKGKGGSRLPQLVFNEVEGKSAFETPSALRAYVDASRDRPSQRDRETHEVLSYEFQPDTCFGGMSASVSWRILVRDSATGKPKHVEVLKKYVVRHPIERNVLGCVTYIWCLSPDEEPIAASENEMASLREGISFRTAVAESHYVRCLESAR